MSVGRSQKSFKTARLVRPDRRLEIISGIVKYCSEVYDIERYCKIFSILSNIVKYLTILSNYMDIAEYASQLLKIVR